MKIAFVQFVWEIMLSQKTRQFFSAKPSARSAPRRFDFAKRQKKLDQMRSLHFLPQGISFARTFGDKGPCHFAIHDLSYSRRFAFIRGSNSPSPITSNKQLFSSTSLRDPWRLGGKSFLNVSALRAAAPYRQKRQDFKKQDSREEVGSPSFTTMFAP
jgi:hypothetical protein